MPRTSKPIVAIICSGNVKDINFSYYITPEHVGQIIADKDSPAFDNIKNWCYINHIECVSWRENMLGEYSLYCEMIDHCDIPIFFWSKDIPDAVSASVSYAHESGRDYLLHIV